LFPVGVRAYARIYHDISKKKKKQKTKPLKKNNKKKKSLGKGSQKKQ
jgi:hypothetical protein